MPDWHRVLQEFRVPPPVPTMSGEVVVNLEPRPKAVLFDIYGTLLCAQVDDLAEKAEQASGVESFVATAQRFGFSPETGIKWHEWFFAAIAEEHREMRGKGIVPAEVQVDHIWSAMITKAGGDPEVTQPRMVAVYREMLANPVRAFAGAAEAVQRLKNAGVSLGIVSNSQFYTMPILGHTLGLDPGEFFEADLTFLSYRLGFAKPAPHFFRLVRTTVMRLGLRVEEALVVGNDWHNDILAAQAHGLQALLFHGNDQSVRPGRPEQEVAVVTSYESLLVACGQ